MLIGEVLAALWCQHTDAASLRHLGTGEADGPHVRRLPGVLRRRHPSTLPRRELEDVGALVERGQAWHWTNPTSRRPIWWVNSCNTLGNGSRRRRNCLPNSERVDASAPSEWDDVLRMVSLLRALESEFAAHRQQAILSQELNAALPVDALVEAILSEKDANVARSVAVGVGEDRKVRALQVSRRGSNRRTSRFDAARRRPSPGSTPRKQLGR